MTYPATVLADSPIGYWRLGEASGTTAVAAAGPNGTYVNTPTLGVAGLLSGDADTAVTFARASAQHVAIPTGIAVGSTVGVTIEVLVKPAAFTVNDSHTIFNWGFANDGTVGHAWLEQDSTAAGNLGYHFADGSKRVLYQPWTPAVGTTYRLVVVHDYVGATVKTYINGVLIGTGDASGFGTPLVIPVNSNSYISSYNGSLFGWNGTLDEVAIYKTLLNQAQVTAHYDASFASAARSQAVVVA